MKARKAVYTALGAKSILWKEVRVAVHGFTMYLDPRRQRRGMTPVARGIRSFGVTPERAERTVKQPCDNYFLLVEGGMRAQLL